MKKSFICGLLLGLSLLLSACPAQPLNDQDISRYMQAFRSLRQLSPELGRKLQSPNFNLSDGQTGLEQLNQSVQKSGFKDMGEFMQYNTKIGLTFSQLQGSAFMGDIDKKMNTGLAQIDAQLKNPKLPELTRQQLLATRESLTAHYQKNKSWATDIQGVMNQSLDPKAAEVVMRHQKELLAMYQGK